MSISVYLCCTVPLTLSASVSELEDLLQALKWAQHSLTDAQSQQDVELLLQFLAKEDFRNSYNIYSVVSQQMNRVSPTSPLTAQAQDLCQEVGVILQQHLKDGNKCRFCQVVVCLEEPTYLLRENCSF